MHRRDPDLEIEAFLDDIGQAIGEAHLSLEIGPGAKIFLEQRQHDEPAEGAGNGEPENAARRAAAPRDTCFRLVDRGEDLQPALIKQAPFVG